MHLASYPSPSNPQISLPCLSILGEPPAFATAAATSKIAKINFAAATSEPAFIMVGLDDKAKPHASWFAADQADAAATAASLMAMAVISVEGDELTEIAAALPRGKLFESGKAFVPFVKRSTYDQLTVHLSENYLTAAAARIEAAAAEGADYAKASKGETSARKLFDWQKIAVGDVVLASDGPSEGWYEAKVLEVRPDSHFLLQWRDWPEVEAFERYLTDIALLHPEHVES